MRVSDLLLLMSYRSGRILPVDHDRLVGDARQADLGGDELRAELFGNRNTRRVPLENHVHDAAPAELVERVVDGRAPRLG